MFYKSRKSYIIAIVGISILGTSFSYAQQECQTCSAPAEQMTIMKDFIVEILTAIQTFGDNDNQLGEYTNPGLPSGPFQQGIVNIDEDRRNVLRAGVEASVQAANKLAQSAQVTATILATDTYDLLRKDSFGGLAILGQTEAIVRDRSSLQQLDSYIQDKQYEMGLAAIYNHRLTPQDYQTLSQVIDQYNMRQKVPFQGRITEQTTYSNIIMMTRRMVSASKRFLSVGNIEQYGKNDFSRGGFSIIFDMNQIQSMKDQYACARFGDTCAGNLQQFTENMESIGKSAVQGAKQSINTVEDAFKRLKAAFSVPFKDSTKLTTEEKEILSKNEQLLRIVYGSDTSRIINGGFGGWKDVGDDGKKSLQNLKSFMANTTASLAEKIATLQALKEEIQNMSQKSMSQDERQKQQQVQKITNDFENFIMGCTENSQNKKNIKCIVDATFAFNQKEHKKMRSLFNIAETSSATIYYPLLVAQLDKVATIVGNKDSKGSIVESLGRSCELQCSNHGGRCWY